MKVKIDSGKIVYVTAKYIKTVNNNHDHFKVTIKHNGKQYTFSFYESAINSYSENIDLKSALCSIILDGNVSDNFEDFCSEFGYDSDSRTAEKIWKQCLKVKENLNRIGLLIV